MPNQFEAFSDQRLGPPLVLQFHFEEQKYPLLLSLSGLMYDLELAHDLAVILSYPQYKGTTLATPFFFYRNGRPINPEHQARAARVVKNSPLFLEVVVAAVGGVWALVQILDRVSTWSLNRKKLLVEIEKLGYEAALKQLELADQLSARLQTHDAQRVEQMLVSRFERSDFRLTDLSVRPLDDAQDGRRD